MSGSQTPQDRLAAAARVLAAAETLARAGVSFGGSGEGSPAERIQTGEQAAAASTRSRMPGESASSAAARLWVAGVEPEGDGQPDREEEARQIVLRQLTMGPRTRKQLADKLREREYEDDVVDRVLDRMTAVGLVDDAAYAETLVRTKQAGRGLSRRALAQELRSKGVDDELVAEALGSLDPESERALAEALAAKKMRAMGGLEPQVQSRRLVGMLARKGYPPSVIYAVVRDAVNGAPEHQRD
ncbi:MAG: regulatory protein RecX [Lapillicoccus sp.]